MPRKSVPLVVTEDDEKRLIEIAKGQDDVIAKRAEIILACKDSVKNKEVAKRLNVVASTVGYWKEAYREKGIDGIGYPKPGYREKALAFNLDEEVMKAANSNEKWTITSLAKHLGAPLDQVEKSVERQHLTFKRTARWTIRTTDSIMADSVELVGVWLGQDKGILVTCTNEFGLSTSHGVLVTSCSSLSKALSQGTVPLENAIIEASFHNDPVMSSSAGKDAAFLEDYFQSAPKSPGLCYQIFGFGEGIPRVPQGRLSDTAINWSESIGGWLRSFRQWVGANGSSTKLSWAERLCDYLTIYLTSENQEKRSVFRWSKAIERIGTKEAPIRAADEGACLAGETASEQLARLLSDVDEDEDDSLSVHFAVAVCGKDSRSYSVISHKVLEEPGQFSFDSMEGLLCGIDAVESSITEAAREAGMQAISLSVEELKKKEPLGALRKVKLELLNGRFELELPVKVLSGLRKGSRLKTSSYLMKICKKVINGSFRESYEDFIETHRGGRHSELSFMTFIRDIKSEGARLVKKKSGLIKEILAKHNFSPTTGQYQGEELPDELKCCRYECLELDTEEIMRQLIPDWDPKHPSLPTLDEDSSDSEPAGDEPREMTPEEKLQEMTLQDFASHFAKYEAEDYKYSRPDTARIEIKKTKRRGKRDEVPEDSKSKTLTGYIRWFNQQATQLSNPAKSIFRKWHLEKDSSHTVIIMPDVVYVDKQEEKHKKASFKEGNPGASQPDEGGKQKPCEGQPKTVTRRSKGTAKGMPKTKNDDDAQKRIGHMNIRIETESGYYNITSTDKQESFLEMKAVLLENNLLSRHIVVFMDGEKDLSDRMKATLDNWDIDIYLDWHHLQDKVYEKLSHALRAIRIPDPRIQPTVYKIGKKKGQIKSMAMTSISRLYARALCAILWVGNTQEAINFLKNIDPCDIASQDILNELITYLENKREWITCYALRKRAGLRNSSNGVEGLNLTIVARRQKHNGMAWLIGSSILAALTCMFKNHQEKEWFAKRTLSFKLVPHPKVKKAVA